MNKELIDKIITYNYNEFGNEFGDCIVDMKKEIERLNNQLDFIKDQNKYIDKLEKMVKERNSIIKEAREYINEDKNCVPKHIKEYFKEILDKVGDK